MTTVLDVELVAGRPAVVTADAAAEPAAWLAEHRAAVDAVVDQHGAALVRGLRITGPVGAEAAIRALSTELMTEREAFAPRERYAPGVYSSTSWPPDQPMCMHHELTYAAQYPARQLFCCLAAPERGGATALADGAAVLRDLPAELVDRFDRHGWRLLRAHNDILSMPWQVAFGTEDRAAVEAYLRDGEVEWRWDADGGLRTSRLRPAVTTHPVSGERVWFNQVAFLNEWTMDPAVREYLMLEFGRDGLPFNTLCGDGEPLDRETVDLINEVYTAHTVRTPWRAGDVLVVDNIRMAHSREAFEGPRQIVVGLDRPTRQSKLSDR
ncbi:TauD/TfdA family dioxygenase [Dactylosporangium matsuzakiense]|uniref:Protein AmbC n=1 Tax=Dactylosporangium matsuzakiense TaxID=53360 RepID=A0A9W6KTR5_9ACTN|nr:TauD/TfdA family dioxygenase [Dactylosporangium matsuzakiense]UWZ42308.1 TauD/TfdA family dioxygenase [Dactylosporangium matsuzakiense]GLL05319.1 protein AmbC [Dactylosporangium matsuzakiense]